MEYQISLLVRTKGRAYDLQGIKEDLACYCERFGDVSLLDVSQVLRAGVGTEKPEMIAPEQLSFLGEKNS